MSKLKPGQIRISHIVSMETRDKIKEFARLNGLRKANIALEKMVDRASKHASHEEEINARLARIENTLVNLFDALSIEKG